MFSLKKQEEEPRRLAEALDRAIQDQEIHPSHSKEYTAIAANVRVLTEANAADKAAYKPPMVSPDMKAAIAANLAGILVIISYERAHVLTSKALAFIVKPKI